MKTLSANILCCNCKLYKFGILIAFIYLIPNLIIIANVFGSGYDVDDYTLPLFCALTVVTSILLIKGLMEERHHFLLPWLANVAVLIFFNIMILSVQFDVLNREQTKQSFYVEFGFFISLEIQILFWFIVYCLLKRGYQKSKTQNGAINSISENVAAQENYCYKVNLTANDHLITDKKVICV